MNAYANQMNLYKNAQILNASPEQILMMLYDGAIRFCREAQVAMAAKDLRTQADKISRAMAIVTEFSNTLNREVGGEIAENLDALYAFMNRELVRANLEKDAGGVKTVEVLLSDLRETWAEAIDLNRKASHPVAATPPPPADNDENRPRFVVSM
ncbi:flagellar export chaperone FliS [Pelovirga terrestris]|uniref:Flagellar secretion chaperone FliS n=1 Tax=Pelovirga terrestris TaxID=2771352 RepID=A0A8J6QRY4_9BACT|nr:flagellar export chaperone FliS [Pelovirga terrestris]MBD1401273.1 flagellar export chaperone FliS [Pelovirga terrestris]